MCDRDVAEAAGLEGGDQFFAFRALGEGADFKDDGRTFRCPDDVLFGQVVDGVQGGFRQALAVLGTDPDLVEAAVGGFQLAGRLDELLPAAPAMAAVLAEEMAEAFADGAKEFSLVDPTADKAPAGGNTGSPKAGPGPHLRTATSRAGRAYRARTPDPS